jgi:O-antigen/teichoic acid export membrane protein
VGADSRQRSFRAVLRPLRGSATMRNSLVACSSGLVSGLLNAAVLALSARHGQTSEVAAYTVVTAALAFVAIAVGGGSSLLYASGDSAQRQAVRSQWVFVTLPSLIIGALLVATFYTHWGYRWPALLAAGAVAIGNNLAQLQLGDLARQLRFTSSAMLICGSKLPALVLATGGTQLTTTLLVASVVQFVAAETALGTTSWLRRPALAKLSPREGISAFRRNRQLFTYTLAELYGARAASIMLSLLATPRMMGCFGVISSAYQALGGVLNAGLQVPMMVKARDRHGIGERAVRNRDAEGIAIFGATIIAACAVAAAPWITGNVLHLPIPESADWLRVLAAALPFMTVNRAVILNLIGDGDYPGATSVTVLMAAIVTPIAAVTVPIFGPLGVASATLGAESITAAVLGVALARRRNFVAIRREM